MRRSVHVPGFAGLALLGALILAAPQAEAGACASPPIRVQPGASFARNGALLLEVAPEDRELLNASLGRMRLLGDGVSVPLVVRRRLEGDFLEVVVAPASPLPPRASLWLSLGDPESDRRFRQMPVTTTDAVDEGVPRWLAPPKVLKHTDDSAKGARYDVWSVRVLVASASHVWAAIESQDGVATAQVEAIRGDVVEIGTKTCFGVGKKLGGVGPWRVTLTAIGADGRESAAPGPPVVFRAPAKAR